MSKIKDGILGLCVGDALGVPVEFQSREELKQQPVTDMIGYGTYRQPPGTWSDDASLTLCLLESLANGGQLDTTDIANLFIQWFREGFWSAHGYVFDIGNATRDALEQIDREGIPPESAGGSGEYSNGNGSLMRILPLAFYIKAHDEKDVLSLVERVSSITHRHRISVLACYFYVYYVLLLLTGGEKLDCYRETVDHMQTRFGDDPFMAPFEQIMSGELHLLPETEIRSSGYVVHTLEASLWSLLTTQSYEDAVLRAVNLGEDTDTTGAVTGGMAGIYFGITDIPARWLEQLARVEDIERLCERFAAVNTL
jgi:ADP-ribosylglycohydrolase